MQFNIESKELQNAVKAVLAASEQKSTIPILAGIQIAADTDRQSVTFTATDLECSMSLEVEAAVSESGVTVIHGGQLAKAIKPAKKGARIAVRSGEQIEIGPLNNGQIPTFKNAVVSYGSVTVNVESFAVESYPCIPTIPDEPEAGAVFTSDSLKRAIARVAPFISAEESRFTLNGALLNVTTDEFGARKCELVATDGHRLIVETVPIEGFRPQDQALVFTRPAFKALVSRHGINLVSRFATGDVAIAVKDDNQYFVFRGGWIVARKLTGNFPDYQRVLPQRVRHCELDGNGKVVKREDLTAVANRAELLAAVESAIPFANERTSDAKLILNGSLRIETKQESREFSSDVAATWDGPEYFSIRLNLKYLRDALKPHTSESVTFRLASDVPRGEKTPYPQAADLFFDGSTRAVIMPMRD